MTTHKPKKVTKYRGSKTHGCGSMKKRRGAGNRGGRGNAGTGKRADQKKPSISSDPYYFGKFGFVKKNPNVIRAVSLAYFEQKINKLVLDKKAMGSAGVYTVDLSDLGFDKLLGTGRLTKKVNFSCEQASARAVKKVKGAGGSVNIRRPQRTAGVEDCTIGQKAAAKAAAESVEQED